MARATEREMVDVGDSSDPAEIDLASIAFGHEHGPHRAPWFRGYGTIVVAMLGLLIAGAVVVSVSDAARQQVGLSFIPKPERYTELYFSGERPVESVTGPAGESVDVRFTISNHQGRAEAVRYTVRVVDDAETPLFGVAGSLQIKDAGVNTISSTIPMPAATPWSAVEVTLDGRPERLRFLRAQVDAVAR